MFEFDWMKLDKDNEFYLLENKHEIEAAMALKENTEENEIQIGSNQSVGKFSTELSEYTKAQKLNLEIGIEGTDIVNDWDFWVYPATLPDVEIKEVYISNSLDQKAIETLEKGGKVLLTAAGKIEYGKDAQQYYSPVFWNTSWFKMRPPHTTGYLS